MTMGMSSVLLRTAIVTDLSLYGQYFVMITYTGTLVIIVAIHSIHAITKLRNSIKVQSDWSHLVRGAGTTRCTVLYQTLSQEGVTRITHADSPVNSATRQPTSTQQVSQ